MDDVSNVFRHSAKPGVIVFMAQVLIVFIVVMTCLVNLTLYPNSETKSVWVTFLTGSLGYMMPHPNFKFDMNETKAHKMSQTAMSHGSAG